MPLAPQPVVGPTGPAAPPTANPGAEAAADAKVREAVHLLEMCIVAYQTGSEKHKAVVDAVSKLSKFFPASAEVPGVQATALAGLAAKAKQNAMMQAAMRQQQAQQAGGGGEQPPSMAA